MTDPNQWKYDAAQQLLDLHEATLKAAEGGPSTADEWGKLVQDYRSMCQAIAAVLAALVLDLRPH